MTTTLICIALICIAFLIGYAVLVYVFWKDGQHKSRRAEIENLREQFADAQRSHKPREHIRRTLVSKVCEELRG